MWAGIAVIAWSILSGCACLVPVSPMLAKGSDITLLHAAGEHKWSHRADYRASTNDTPVLIPLPPKL